MRKPKAPSYTQLRRFASFILSHHPHYELDGADLQSEAVHCNLLVEVTALRSCGRFCACAEYGDFPCTCYRLNRAKRKKGAA